MKNTIGIRHGFEDPARFSADLKSLKRQVLLFDKIHINALDVIIPWIYDSEPNLTYEVSELEYLIDQGIISGVKGFSKEKISDDLYREIMDEVIQISKEEMKPYDQITQTILNIELTNRYLRTVALLTRYEDNVDSYPILSSMPLLGRSDLCEDSAVMNIILKNLPVPDSTTPWQDILTYKDDSDTRLHYLDLKRWARRVSSTNLSHNEIEEELEWLLLKLKRHLKIHKIKADTEMFEVILKAPLSLIENIMTLKFSKICEPIFAIRKRNISLMTAEIEAPGEELFYIHKTQQKFSKRI